ncbi:MAG: GNAT family N-acetyltransferase [Candidatus Dormibacteria bacterium]
MSAARLIRLSAADLPVVFDVLDAAPVENAYLRSEAQYNGPGDAPWWGVTAGGALRSMVMAGPVVVPWIPEPGDAEVLAAALAQQLPPRMSVGPRVDVWTLHRGRGSPPLRETRDAQPLLCVGRAGLLGVAQAPIRRSTLADVGLLSAAAAAMHREEIGGDGVALDPAAWRARMTTLVRRGWSYVWSEDRTLIFKCELSAVTPRTVQLQGVWTAPSHRRQGVARRALLTVCRQLLREVDSCSLYVNAGNTGAERLYETLGFTPVGEYATLLY